MMEKELDYLKEFAFKLGEGAQLSLDGECGFGRACVGIMARGNWVDYDWDDQTVTSPPDAYHKHNCIAVLGHGEDSIKQLFDWCKSFEEAGFDKVVIRENPDMNDMPLATRQMMAIMGTAMTPQIVRA